MRTAIYARYSTDMQNDASIEDQIRVCSLRAEKEEWQIANTYTDYALSGASLMRPGIQGLIQDALSGKFDQVLAEDIAGFYKRMEFSGVRIFTLTDGIITDLHIGLKGTMSARFLKDLAEKTHRGLRGRVEKGKSGGGNSYGYDVVHTPLGNGEIEVGDRKINQELAQIVNRIFAEYLAGRSPKKIAVGLNEDGIPAPTAKGWGPSTIYGNRERGTGILNNELYIGRMVWNRVRYVKDPETRKRVSRLNPEDEWVIHDVPHLRIVDQDVWERVKEKQGVYSKRADPSVRKHRPRKLLSHLVKCGVCGGGCSMVSQTHMGCSTARNKGTCDNRKTIKREKLEQAVIGVLQQHLMDQSLCQKFCQEYTSYMNAIRRQHNLARASYESELKNVERENKKLVDAILRGVPPETLVEKGNWIVKRKTELTALLENTEEAPVLFHPNMAERYHEEVSRLIESLGNEQHQDQASELIRSLVDKITLTPKSDGSGVDVDLIGDLAGILSMATKGDKSLVNNGLSFINQSQQDDPTDLSKRILGEQTIETKERYPDKSDSQVSLVAGVGFEPTTFRL